MRRRTAGLLVLASTMVVAARPAAAACTASVCSAAALPAACCSGVSCTLDGTITIVPPSANAPCDLDFGTRTVTLTGTLRVGPNTLSIEAGSLRIQGAGKLDASGVNGSPGGTVTITTTAGAATAFLLNSTALPAIDFSGGGIGGGTLTILADGDVSFTAGRIDLDGVTGQASGGSLTVDNTQGSTTGSITFGVPLSADSGGTNGGGGGGGYIEIDAAADLTIAQRITADGGNAGGGSIYLSAGGKVTLQSTSVLEAQGIVGGSGDGGSIQATAAAIDALGVIHAAGGSQTGFGGLGGSVWLDAQSGPLVLMHVADGISAHGSDTMDGGDVTLNTESPTNPLAHPPTDGTLTIAAPIDVSGGLTGGGGTIAISAAGPLTTTGPNGKIDVSGTAGGGSLYMSSDDTVNLAAAIDATGADAGGYVTVESDMLSIQPAGVVILDASGHGTDGVGGSLGLSADGDIVVGKNARLLANGGTSGGGEVSLDAGSPDFQNLTGGVTIDGRLFANGTGTAATAPIGALIELSGCTVTISGTGIVDATGDALSVTAIEARTALVMKAGAKVLSDGSNTVTLPIGIVPPSAGTVTPAFTPGPCPDGTVRPDGCPACTDTHTPPGCLMPCRCGDGVLQPGEGCDPSAGADRCLTATLYCDLRCRKITCDDRNPCTIDACSSQYGCANEIEPDLTPCDDETVCNGREICHGGLCDHGKPLNCGDGKPCTDDSCDPQAGCVHPPHPCAPGRQCDPADGQCVVPAGCTIDADCDDHDACDGTETCSGGHCVPGVPLTCDDGKSCTTNGCDAGTGCTYTPVAGCCESDPSPTCNDGLPYTIDTCLPNHTCSHVVDPTYCFADTDCNDGQECTRDSCTANHCAHTARTGVCGDVCHPGVCLVSGACQLGAPPVCDDPDPCTVDSCDPSATGPGAPCVHQAIDKCCHGSSECNDDNQCSIDVCESDTHTCTHRVNDPTCRGCSADTDCDPAGRCAGQACIGKLCVTLPTFDCRDGDPNTLDLCRLDPAGAPVCQHPCQNALACDDDNTCTDDTCVEGSCQHTPRQDGTSCDDGNACNGLAACAAGHCVTTPSPSCDDNDPCTEDSCDPIAGCRNPPRSGLSSVGCHLDAIDDAMRGASTQELPRALGRKLEKRVSGMRSKVGTAGAAEAARQATREARALRAVGKQALGLARLLRGSARRRIAPALGDRLAAQADLAAQAAGIVVGGLTP